MQSSFNTPTEGTAEVAAIEDELRDVVGESEALRDRLAALTHGCVPACSTNHHPSYHLSYSPPTHTQQYTEFLVFLASAVSANRHLRNLLTHLSLSSSASNVSPTGVDAVDDEERADKAEMLRLEAQQAEGMRLVEETSRALRATKESREADARALEDARTQLRRSLTHSHTAINNRACFSRNRSIHSSIFCFHSPSLPHSTTRIHPPTYLPRHTLFSFTLSIFVNAFVSPLAHTCTCPHSLFCVRLSFRLATEEERLRLGISTATAELTVAEHELSQIAEAEEDAMSRIALATMEHAASTRSASAHHHTWMGKDGGRGGCHHKKQSVTIL